MISSQAIFVFRVTPGLHCGNVVTIIETFFCYLSKRSNQIFCTRLVLTGYNHFLFLAPNGSPLRMVFYQQTNSSFRPSSANHHSSENDWSTLKSGHSARSRKFLIILEFSLGNRHDHPQRHAISSSLFDSKLLSTFFSALYCRADLSSWTSFA